MNKDENNSLDKNDISKRFLENQNNNTKELKSKKGNNIDINTINIKQNIGKDENL